MTTLIGEAGQTLWIGVPTPQGAGIALTSDGLRLHRHDEQPELVAWSSLSSVELKAAVSVWRYPRVASWSMNLLAAAMSSWSPGDADVVIVSCRRRDATTVTAEAAAYYLTGYPRAEVDAVQELLHQAVRNPAVRPVLSEPALVLEAIRRSLQAKEPLQLLTSTKPKG